MKFAFITLQKNETIKTVSHDGGNYIEVMVPIKVPVALVVRTIGKATETYPVAFCFGDKENEIWFRRVASVPFIHQKEKRDAVIRSLSLLTEESYLKTIDEDSIEDLARTILERHETKLKDKLKLFT